MRKRTERTKLPVAVLKDPDVSGNQALDDDEIPHYKIAAVR
jgi:hypothetical protein